jgi:hypothetical protein
MLMFGVLVGPSSERAFNPKQNNPVVSPSRSIPSSPNPNPELTLPAAGYPTDCRSPDPPPHLISVHVLSRITSTSRTRSTRCRRLPPPRPPVRPRTRLHRHGARRRHGPFCSAGPLHSEVPALVAPPAPPTTRSSRGRDGAPLRGRRGRAEPLCHGPANRHQAAEAQEQELHHHRQQGGD